MVALITNISLSFVCDKLNSNDRSEIAFGLNILRREVDFGSQIKLSDELFKGIFRASAIDPEVINAPDDCDDLHLEAARIIVKLGNEPLLRLVRCLASEDRETRVDAGCTILSCMRYWAEKYSQVTPKTRDQVTSALQSAIPSFDVALHEMFEEGIREYGSGSEVNN